MDEDFGGASGRDVATRNGTVVDVGTLFATADFGGGPIVASSSNDTYIAAFDASGQWLWDYQFTGYGSFPTGVAIGSSGEVVVVGGFAYNIDFGEGSVDGTGSSDLFLAKFDPSGGLLFAKTFGGQYQVIHGLAFDSLDNIVISGYFAGDLDFGSGPITGSGETIYVAKFNSSGNAIWSKAFESSGSALGFDVAVDPFDDILVAGSFQGTLATPAPLTASNYDVVVIKLDSGGDFIWAKSFGGADTQDASAVGSDGAANVYVTGRALGGMDFGNGWQNGTGMFVAKLAP